MMVAAEEADLSTDLDSLDIVREGSEDAVRHDGSDGPEAPGWDGVKALAGTCLTALMTRQETVADWTLDLGERWRTENGGF